MANPHKSERILFQLFSNSVIVIVIVIVARMRVSRVGVKQKIISPEGSELKKLRVGGNRIFHLRKLRKILRGTKFCISRAVPEPSMFGLVAGTLALALAGTRRRRRK